MFKKILLASTAIVAGMSSTLASNTTNNFAGLVASNSAGGTGTYTCRSQAQWNKLASDAANQGFRAIRIEGFDCDALDMASPAAASAGIQIFAGLYVHGTIASSLAQIDNDVQTFRTAYAKYGAGRYVALTVGNEINDTASNIMAKVNDIRSHLVSAGVTTPVSTAHTWDTIRDNPALCGADFIAANAHTVYHDGNVTSDQAGEFVFKTVVPSLKEACPGKKVYVSEAGWPSGGPSNGVAVASLEDQLNAIVSLNSACRDDTNVSVYAFEYDDQLWKGDDNEESFGIFGNSKILLSRN